MCAHVAKHTILFPWPQSSQPPANPLPSACLLKLEMKACTWCHSCKQLTTWAWSGYSKLQEDRFMNQSSLTSSFVLPLFSLCSTLRFVCLVTWQKFVNERKQRGESRGELQSPNINLATNCSVYGINETCPLLVTVVCRQIFRRPYTYNRKPFYVWLFHHIISS